MPPNPDGTPVLQHLNEIKIIVCNQNGELLDRLSPWATYVKQSSPLISQDVNYKQYVWSPPVIERYKFQYPRPKLRKSLRVYECHIGIASPDASISTYDYFADRVIPRIYQLGYSAIQLMAIMEHAYYASFGYQVTSYFAASSRFGTPEQLKRLIDIAHAHSLVVILDVVHSHASRNVQDGLNQFDGSDSCYFHEGERGYHPQWDSRLFNYAEYEVLRFLLSNLRWWFDVYQFDGFRLVVFLLLIPNSLQTGSLIVLYKSL